MFAIPRVRRVFHAFLHLALLLGASRIGGASLTAQEPPSTTFWWIYLIQIGEQHDCWFTIEVMDRPADDPKIRADSRVTEDKQPISLEAAVRKVSAKFPWLKFIKNKKNPNVIHVIDDELAKLDGYALERGADVNFAGVVDDVVFQLQKQNPGIGPKTWGFTGASGIMADGWTEVAFHTKGGKVRDVLTDCVPLGGYKHVLWKARTTRADGGPQTTVEYYGLKQFDWEIPLHWPWWSQLHFAGKRLNCHFTIETIYRHADDPKAVPVFLSENEEFASVDALIDAFSKRIPWLRMSKDPNRPNLIHAIDRDLLEMEGYALGKSVGLNYTGTPDGAVLALGDHVGHLCLLSRNETMACVSNDCETRFSVDVKDRTIRDILSDGLPVDAYEPVLWHARTWLTAEGPKTSVEYMGLRRRK